MNAARVYVGVVAQDRLRLMGLQTILEESGLVVRPGSLNEALKADDLAAVLLDGACIADMRGVVGQFRQQQAGAKVVVMGRRFGSGYVHEIVAAGAKGYLEETASETEIHAAMHAVLRGSVWVPKRVMARLIGTGEIGYGPDAVSESLEEQMTQREREVLRLLMSGRTNRQIAEAMGVEAVTVKAHMGRMLRKAGAKNRVELTLKAMLNGPEALAKA